MEVCGVQEKVLVFPGKFASLPNLMGSPTTVHSEISLEGNDNWEKCAKKGRPK
jgi:hypothetical protein